MLRAVDAEQSTIVVTVEGQRAIRLEAPRFSLRIGEERTTFTLTSCALGAHRSNDLVVDDAAASRFHCRIHVEAEGFRLVDDGSRNGTRVNGVHVTDAWLEHGAAIRIGETDVVFELDEGSYEVPLHPDDRLGSLVGRSVAMRRVFALLERAARSEVTVLLLGETGTGKEACAEALHASSDRADGPFVVVDAGALPPTLLESELFGHEKGAFTGATHQRIGAFEAAQGGTVFLDEIGELPPDLQPKLLRVLERKTIRRVGATAQIPVDVRIVAATHRNLREAVNEGSFRADLYYRLAVLPIEVPALRERPEDLDVLVPHLLDSLGATKDERARLERPGFVAQLRRGRWPGNVRELRNHLERCLVLETPLELPGAPAPDTGGASFPVDAKSTYQEARRRALDLFEKHYLEALLEEHDGNVAAAARAAEMNRPYLYRLLRRHGLR